MIAFRNTAALLALALLVSCATTSGRKPMDDILGVKLGMPRDAVHSTLAATATLGREERKRQEIWNVRGTRVVSLIVGYDADWDVRFVTAVADIAGENPVRYADVLDVATATRAHAGPHYTYTWTSPRSPYQIIAIGDEERVQYYSLKKTGESEEEDEEEEH
jgi:hypothetical protein